MNRAEPNYTGAEPNPMTVENETVIEESKPDEPEHGSPPCFSGVENGYVCSSVINAGSLSHTLLGRDDNQCAQKEDESVASKP